MPSYFCCKCHRLVSAERNVPPDAFLCPDCREESRIKKSGSIQKKVGDGEAEEEQLAVCSVGDWR
jgi:hypothetical protein